MAKGDLIGMDADDISYSSRFTRGSLFAQHPACMTAGIDRLIGNRVVRDTQIVYQSETGTYWMFSPSSCTDVM